MKYGYARVSTVDQNVTQQAQKLIEQYSIEPENIIQEVWTGKTTEQSGEQSSKRRQRGLQGAREKGDYFSGNRPGNQRADKAAGKASSNGALVLLALMTPLSRSARVIL